MDYQEAIYCMKVMADEEVCEECNYYQSCDHTKQADMARIVIYAMQELQEYKKLGTMEEVREAVEKQRAKKPKNAKTEGYRYTDTYRCPTCGRNFSGTGIAEYCYHCGQKLNWSEEEE